MALEEKIAALEGGEAALAFGSGMAAITAVLMALVGQGDNIVHSSALYGCTFAFLHELFSRFGVTATGVDTADLEAVKQAIQPETKVVYIETPANPTMRISDIEAIAEIAHAHGATVVVDNFNPCAASSGTGSRWWCTAHHINGTVMWWQVSRNSWTKP